MKKLLCFFIFTTTFLMHGYSQANHSHNADELKPRSVTAADWQSDLRFLQHTVNNEYPFLFKNISAANFNQSVEKLYREIPGLQPHEILAGFARLVASFKYGHTDIGWRESPVKYHVVPVNFYWFSDGVYAEGTHPDHKDVLGAKLIKVEGVPVMEALELLKPLVPAENDSYYKAYGLTFLQIPEALHAQKVAKKLKNEVTYTFEKDGRSFEKTIAGLDSFRISKSYGYVKPGAKALSVRDANATPYYLKNLDKIYYYEYLPEYKAVYVRQSQVQDEASEPIPHFYKKVFDFIEQNDVEKLILDVRLNGGGNNYKNKPVITSIVEHPKINKTGNLFVIIGRRTFSACQNLVNELSNYTNAIFVGEPTAENINFYGDNRQLTLPKTGLPVYLSYAWWQDKPQWENAPWMAPQIAINTSFADYKANKDPALQVCLNFKDNDLVLDPMNYLKDLFMAGKLKEVEAEAKRLVADERYRYVDFEGKINQSGYNLLNDKKPEQATYVFELNTRLFPKSANVWDSYAEALWKMGKPEKAIEYYNQAIALDPGGVTGKNAKEMIKKINSGKMD